MAMALLMLLLLLILHSGSLGTSKITVQAAEAFVGELKARGASISLPIGTPPQQQLLSLDLDADVSWLQCGESPPAAFSPSKSSTFSAVSCSSKICSKKCSSGGQCLQPISKRSSVSLFQDSVGLKRTEGRNPKGAIVLKGIAFGCAQQNRKKRSRGIAALSKNSLSLPLQISTTQKSPPKFTLCRSPDSASPIFFGDDSSFIISGINISNYVQFVPFVSNPVFPSRYYLGVQTIQADSADLRISPSVFAINPKTGIGGVKFSSRDRYTKLVRPAYVAVSEAFKSYAARFSISIVPAVAPLQLCFNASGFNFNRIGPVVPTVDFVLGNVTWSLPGFNTIEFFENNAVGCLAFVDAGPAPATSSIGLFQQFDNLLHFDVGGSRFGFIDRSLHILRTGCKFFNVA